MALVSSPDAIVVGAGAAGCVVAAGLADAGLSVALCEAGPGLPAPPSLTTLDALDALAEPLRFWPGVTTEGVGPRPPTPYRLGRGVGGGTAVNAMVMTTGDRADYDHWARERGATGWDWTALAPSFATITAAMVTETAPLGPLATAVGTSLGWGGRPGSRTGLRADSAEIDGRGFAPAALAAADGRRNGAAEAMLAGRLVPGPAPGARSATDTWSGGAGSIRLLAGHQVVRIRFDGRRACGVDFDDGTGLDGGRVVVCGGTLHTPTLLRDSGVAAIGDVRPVVDHPSFVIPIALAPAGRCDPDRVAVPVSALVRWSSSGALGGAGRGPAGSGPVPDLMGFVMDHVGSGPEQRRYGAIVVVGAEVGSVGSIRWTGSHSGAGRRRFDPGWLAAPEDGRRLVAGVRQVARLLADTALGPLVEAAFADDVGTPLADVVDRSDAELERWLAAHPGPVVHPGSSCGPVPLTITGGPTPDPVIELDGSVRGRERLHVIDGSALPQLPVANPQLPIMAVAHWLTGRLVGAIM